jgi:hypothetical protein
MPNSSAPQTGGPRQAATGTGSAERLVPREEQPVDVQDSTKAAPRVISTVPIFQQPSAGPPNGMAPPGAFAAPAPAPVNTAPVAAPPSAAAPAPAPSVAPAPAVASTQPKKIHTVVIRPDQPGAAVPMPAAAPAPAPTAAPFPAPAPAPTARTVAPALRPAPQPAPKPAAAPAPLANGNGPLELIPQQGVAQPAAPAPRTRTALAPAPMPIAAPAAGGGYEVQVTSQRSEDEAKAAFRTLRAKFPTQLGNREPVVRRADLGDKGVYYRALVGPFASVEQATGLCSSLKAAGGTCIVQKQ